MNIHPGVLAAFRRLNADELGVARLMASGDLLSPQRYMNVTLVNLRITGTGVSYRPALEEYVFRKPENYLTEEFLARCNGLPVIMHHPAKTMLNSEEYGNRTVGSVMLPYIKGNEVWAIAKIYDDDAIKLLETEQMSTSPAVLLEGGTKLKLEDGTELLIEGKPSLLDHLAICKNGVWDKGGIPTGIEQSNLRGDSIMAEKTEAEKDKERMDAMRADAEVAAEKRMDEKIDMLLKGIDSLRADMASCNSRMDAFEKEESKEKKEDSEEDEEKKDSEEDIPEEIEAKRLAADKRKDSKRKDAEEEMKEKERADSIASFQRQMEEQAKTIARLSELVRQPIPELDRAELTSIQSRADSAMIQLGERAPQPMAGETPIAYRRRMTSLLQRHSDRWKNVRLDSLDETTFKEVAESQIYADAAERAKRPNDIPAGRMREVRRQDPSGHIITEFYGNNASFISAFSRPTRRARIGVMGAAR